MTILNWLLLSAGETAQWLWGALGSALGGFFGAINVVVNPLLARIVAGVNAAGTWVGNLVYAVLSPLPVWLGLTLLAIVCGFLMLFAFKHLSNQTAIGRSRDRMTAHLLALKLFKDDIGVAFHCQLRLAGALLTWQWHMLKPMILLIILLLPVFAQMGTRYQWRPLQPGEEALIKLRLHPEHLDVRDATLASTDGVAEVVGPVPGGGELVWRIRAGEPGRYQLLFDVDDHTVVKELVVGAPFQPVSAERPSLSWTSQILHPIEWPFPSDSIVQHAEITYPGVESYIYGANWWILYFFVVSMVAAIALLPFYKVRF